MRNLPNICKRYAKWSQCSGLCRKEYFFASPKIAKTGTSKIISNKNLTHE